MKIILDLSEVDDYNIDTIKEWLKMLFEEEISNAKGDIDNNEIWKNGSSNDEEIFSHESNITCNEEYISVLRNALKQLD